MCPLGPSSHPAWFTSQSEGNCTSCTEHANCKLAISSFKTCISFKRFTATFVHLSACSGGKQTNNNTGRAPQNPEQVLVRKVGKDCACGRGTEGGHLLTCCILALRTGDAAEGANGGADVLNALQIACCARALQGCLLGDLHLPTHHTAPRGIHSPCQHRGLGGEQGHHQAPWVASRQI